MERVIKTDKKTHIKKKKKNRGFTLIEVILVVAIITIISAIAVPQVGKYLNKANRSKVIGAVAELNNSSTSWSINHGGDMPANLQDVFTEQGDLKKLGIGLDTSGNFKIGNITGKIELDSGEVYAKINAGSKAFPGEEIRR